jgi:hypothetical protein
LQPPFTADDRKRTMDKIIKGKLVLPAYLTVDARELIRSVRYMLNRRSVISSLRIFRKKGKCV